MSKFPYRNMAKNFVSPGQYMLQMWTFRNMQDWRTCLVKFYSVRQILKKFKGVWTGKHGWKGLSVRQSHFGLRKVWPPNLFGCHMLPFVLNQSNFISIVQFNFLSALRNSSRPVLYMRLVFCLYNWMTMLSNKYLINSILLNWLYNKTCLVDAILHTGKPW